MVKVAVAAATSSIGRYIVEAIAATNKHELVLLSQRPTPIAEFAGIAHEYKTVDYADPASLRAALTGVHTVILTHGDPNPDTFVKSSLALLDAAVAAGVKRFVPSEFATRGLPNDPLEGYTPKAIISEAVQKTGLEYTIFEVGVFMNFLGVGTPGVGNMGPFKPFFDIENCTASFVGDGEYHLVMTLGEDIGRFVAASLELEKWPEVSRMAGDRKTMNEIVAIAEAVRDDAKKQLVPSPMFPAVNLITQCLIVAAENPDRWGFADANLNRLLPEVKPVTIEEFLRKWWGKADANLNRVKPVTIEEFLRKRQGTADA